MSTTAPEAAYTGEIPRTPLRFLWYTVKPFWPWLVLGVSLNITINLINTYIAVFIGNLADATNAIATPDDFLGWAMAFVALLMTSFVVFRLASFTAIHFVLKQQKLAFEVVKDHLLQHSHTYFINRFSGTLAGKVFHASDRSGEMLLMINYGFVRLAMSFIATGVVIAFYNLQLAGVYLIIVLIAIAVNLALVKWRRPMVVEYAKVSSKYRGQITDVVSNIQAVRQFSATANEYAYLQETLRERLQKDRKQWTTGEWSHVINNVLTAVLLIAMIGGIYLLLVNGSVTAGAMVAVMILMYRIAGVMIDLGDWMNRMIRVYGEVEEGLSEIFVNHEIADVPDAKVLDASQGEIAWQNVTFTFGQNNVFNDFNLTIAPGQRVGLVGPSGAGKTTFVSLLLRQHDIDGGVIAIDGQNIAAVTQDSLREAIAVVPQEPMLFHRTIRENIAYGKPDATDEEIIAVAKKAQAHDFIATLEDGYETLVGERGVKLSGGQKQRIAIARAMLKDAPILMLDEATSALDSESEVAIQKALHELMEGKTVIAVAHRLSTLREMDRILVLENGQVVEDGSHDELAKRGGTYQRLWEHQAGGFVGE